MTNWFIDIFNEFRQHNITTISTIKSIEMVLLN